MKKKKYTGQLNHNIIYYERDTLRITRDFIWGDDERRKEINQRRTYKDSKFLGIDCLIEDGIATREAVEARLRELAPPPELPPESEIPEGTARAYADAGEEPPTDIPATTIADIRIISEASINDGNKRMTAVANALGIVKEQFVKVEGENRALILQNAQLQSRVALLEQQLAHYLKIPFIQSIDDAHGLPAIAKIETTLHELDDLAYASRHGLPHQTMAGKWQGKTRRFSYTKTFRESFENLDRGYKKQTRKNLRIFAEQGSGYPSFRVEKIEVSQGWMSVPHDVRDYLCCRISGFLRFAFNLINENVLIIYDIDKKSNHP